MLIIWVIASLILGFLISFIIFRLIPNQHIATINEEIYAQQIELEQNINELTSKVASLDNEKKHLHEDIHNLEVMRLTMENNIQHNISLVKQTAEQELEQSLLELAQRYQDQEEQYKQTYLSSMREYATNMNAEIALLEDEKAAQQLLVDKLKNDVDKATEAAKREVEKRDAINFYKLILSEQDLLEINKLRQVEPYLRDKEALNKVIWKTYYEKAYTDLIGRVIGNKIKTGIYKITNTENQMCYVGQSVNIATRWKQHIQRGIGAEAPTRNKLYPAMLATGVENFTFEIIEECDKNNLDEREKYWQNYFNALTYGYSMR